MTALADIADAHRRHDWRTWKILRRRAQVEVYLTAFTFKPEKMAKRGHGRRYWVRVYACGCIVPQGYPLHRGVEPCARHRAVVGDVKAAQPWGRMP